MIIESAIISTVLGYLTLYHIKTHWTSNCLFSDCMTDIDNEKPKSPQNKNLDRPPTPHIFIKRKSIV